MNKNKITYKMVYDLMNYIIDNGVANAYYDNKNEKAVELAVECLSLALEHQRQDNKEWGE